MSNNKGNKKRLLAAGIVTVIVMGGAGAAYAYWTNTGSGTGDADTGTNAAVTIVQTSDITGIAPGSGQHALSGTITNPNDGPVYVDTITVTISDVTGEGTAFGGCDATDYTITGSPITFETQALADDTTTWSGASIAFNNKAGVNQNDCKNATVVLSYTSD